MVIRMITKAVSIKHRYLQGEKHIVTPEYFFSVNHFALHSSLHFLSYLLIFQLAFNCQRKPSLDVGTDVLYSPINGFPVVFAFKWNSQVFHETLKHNGKPPAVCITSLGRAASSILQLGLWDTDFYMYIAIYSDVNMLMNYHNVLCNFFRFHFTVVPRGADKIAASLFYTVYTHLSK